MKNSVIMINGRPYDAITGMPVVNKQMNIASPSVRPAHGESSESLSRASSSPTAASLDGMSSAARPTRTINHAAQKHRKAQRSQTLHRAALKRPGGSSAVVDNDGPVQRSQMITRFSGHKATQPSRPLHHEPHKLPAPATPKALLRFKQNQPAVASQNLPAQRAAAPAVQAPVNQASPTVAPMQQATASQLSGSALKDELIREQLNDVEQQHLNQSENRQAQPARRAPRMATVIASISALVLLGGYLTYLNMPGLSIRVAAAQAGIEASYPSYQPSGYSFSGPVAFSPGEVRVNFHSNTNDFQYSLVQRSSGWDSRAVLDNYVLEETDQYATLQERGLTIYLMQNKAAWVNGGILYVIDGNAPLSSEQIQKIASSTL